MHQDTTIIYIGLAGLAAIFFFALGYFIRKIHAKGKVKNAEDKARKITEEAKVEAEKIRHEAELQAKDLLLKLRTEFERETKDRRQELIVLEKRLIQKEENLDRKVDILERKDKDIERREHSLSDKEKLVISKEKELEKLLQEEKERLQSISGMTRDEARQLLLKKLEDEVKQEAALMIKRTEEEAKEKADKEARKIIGLAIQRCAADHTVETTVSVVNLPNDEMKGRIIGREGRNIRALEIATGIDVIIDDTPEAVILSGFDPIKREIAKIALERLLEDGRIHPGRIEEIVEKVKKDMENTIREEGEKALFDTGLHGLHPEIIKLLGRLKYRTSYGQNVLQHSVEVAHLMGVMASELKLDFNLAKRIGLLHDIGKAVSHEMEGTHSKLGADLARKYGESENICHAIEAHHQDIEPKTLLAVLVQAADSISATRPGARRETLETYVKRLEKLETIADSFKGVAKAYAIQAGREIRVMVQPDKVSDAQAAVLARDITKKIEEGLEYPGQIKVTVVRETRAVEYAK
ncbi:MAG: ribonuclease Y [Candidatus Omnitrophica bacterium]|nr:ribonuclease Y [Candidatus Omnitrophota bacterium]MCM8791435.1 ribonuclease Y [Candidatus Omnitrophota bacterium]